MITDSIEFRRHLHRCPELSFAEHATQRYIIERLGEALSERMRRGGLGRRGGAPRQP